MAVPKMFEKSFIDFTEVKVGDEVVIKTEFANNPKFKSFLIGDVDYKGKTCMLSLNKTSYAEIAPKLSKDTINWIGKELVYMGEQKMGNMMGRLWNAK